MSTLSERFAEIELLMKYAVPEKHKQEAMALLECHSGDGIALNLLHHFYSFLPEARDDGVKMLKLLARSQGTFLICATTFYADYMYIATTEHAVYLGKIEEGIQDQDVLEFFGFGDQEEFMKQASKPEALESYTPANLINELCPICSAACGEYHTLGCPVEICPWCEGQLAHCNCRFIHLGIERLESDKHIEELQEKIEAKGRIPFDERQRPAYPSLDGDNEQEFDL